MRKRQSECNEQFKTERGSYLCTEAVAKFLSQTAWAGRRDRLNDGRTTKAKNQMKERAYNFFD